MACRRDVREAERRDGRPVARRRARRRGAGELRDPPLQQGGGTDLHRETLKLHGSPVTITTDGLRSYGAAMDELGCCDRQEIGRWATTELRTAICRSDGGSERCCVSGRWRCHIRPRQPPQPLQPGAPPHRSTHLPGMTLRRAGGVASPCKLGRCLQRPACIVWRAVRVRLTAPFAGGNLIVLRNLIVDGDGQPPDRGAQNPIEGVSHAFAIRRSTSGRGSVYSHIDQFFRRPGTDDGLKDR